MLLRFSLYGFLKNQRYFAPFLVLAFLERGLSFAQIGLLVAVQEVMVNVLEVPSGVMADLWGRRRCMVASFVAYLAALAAFVVSDSVWVLAGAMALLGTGDAFRTGTHKAMIFAWLEREGRTDDRVEVYGYTRSWSQIGSAVSIPIAAAIVVVTGRYTDVFWATAIPWAIDLLNLATYPKYLDGDGDRDTSLRSMLAHLKATVRDVLRTPRLRTLMAESMSFEGSYKAVKDYLQPVVQTLAVSAPILLWVDGRTRTAIFVGAVYVVVHGLGAVASRNAHRVVRRHGDPQTSARAIWWVTVALFAAMGAVMLLEVHVAAAVALVAIAVLHNVFRPLLVSRIDEVATSARRATVLSVESQSSSLATVVLAPAVGFAVDAAAAALWPVAAIGLAVTAPMLLLVRGRSHPDAGAAG